jgi:acetyltransferase-like isoleucine patch superfamily enzyme
VDRVSTPQRCAPRPPGVRQYSALSDYNLLEFDDDVVIGADAHISGHTVERGVVRTARVRLGNKVTIGVSSIVDIGVVAGDRCQVGALSLVPKHTVLKADTTYFGIPAQAVGPALAFSAGSSVCASR